MTDFSPTLHPPSRFDQKQSLIGEKHLYYEIQFII